MQVILQSISEFLWGLPLLIAILFTGVYFSVRSKFFQFLYLPHILNKTLLSIFKKKAPNDDPSSKGIISSFEAVSTAIGGSVGVANIGGASTAIAVGGPGAVFWLWICALFGMIIKTVEVTLSVHYRSTDENGEPYGGPTYYMEKGLGEENKFRYWMIPAILFGCGIFGTFFFTLQNYTISEAVSSTFNIGMIPVSLTLMLVTYYVIYGGLKHIGKFAARLVPIMVLFYILSGLYIILTHITQIGDVFSIIFQGAFGGTAAVGGFTGAAVTQAISMGMARSVYSNEAGWGTSPMVHSTAKVNHPVKQGLWGAFEVFVDTIVVCSLTAFVIIITGKWSSGMSGAALTLSAFEMGIGDTGRVVITISIFLFGLTTLTGWFVYYEVLLRHLLRNQKRAFKKGVLTFYNWFYPIPGTVLVIYAVSYGLTGQTVWYFADIASAIPTFINVMVILLLSKKFFTLLHDYKARYLGIGKIDPTVHLFYEDEHPPSSTLKNVP
ncbi:alanine/glycine:cation symporter family protein [Virgibacillus chiguensis]|uniref:Alanine or glycine:cation symporter, AGCS family n=1 Tax=Virgibacillus chiguensis TaxID=411959 RepID=A0A1M5RGR1_9BACI|nr:sodium:alanine symporter family protein [Virgibacillus chiguensis]SHH25378.1 alanine or glycine:cation symporter, AGCS family [Virgibacillus chiguensis]